MTGRDGPARDDGSGEDLAAAVPREDFMTCARTFTRAAAALATLALLLGVVSTNASAAPSKKKVPAPTITSKPAALTNARTATFAFTDSLAGVKFSCAIDKSAYAACTSPKTYAGPLAAGSHSFRVRATMANHPPSPTVSVNWTIDLTAPAAPVLSGIPSPSPTNRTDATLTFSDADLGATLLCSLDGTAAAPCTSPKTVTGLRDGTHTFAVTARDAAGNVSRATSGSWTVDTIPPAAPKITTGPADLTNQTSASFAVAEEDETATLTCSLDGGAFSSCGPQVAYTSLVEGTHTLDLRATDAAGNHSDVQFSWTVDLTAPTPPSIDSGPGADTNNPVATFTFTMPASATALECKLDDAASYSDCVSPFSTPTLADGSHTLRVRARDAASNESGVTPYNWTVDTTPPAGPTVTGPAALTNRTTAQFTVTDADDTATFTCRLDGGAAAPCAGSATYSSLVNGSHTLTVTATDPAGNTASAVYSWRVDTIAPSAALGAPAWLTSAATATFSEPVKGVSTSSLALRIVNSTADLRATLTCRAAGGAAVSCAAGPVRTATLRPANPLMPGQQYAVVANPSGHATVADLAGNHLAGTSKKFRASTTVQENSVAATYAWRGVRATSAFGGTYRTAHAANASVAYQFTGTGITWYTVKGRNQGVAYVYVDGVKKATVNNYGTATAYKVGRTVSHLKNAKHTLRIVVAGRKGATKGTGTYVSVDAVKVAGHAVVNSPALSSKWRFAAVKSASGGQVAVADLAGETASMRFKGTSIAWYTSTGGNRGIAKVYVDGALKGTYDLYGSTTRYGVRRAIGNLTNAVHTVKIVVTGAHRAGARGSVIVLDRWVVG
jgi:hypothetical protein